MYFTIMGTPTKGDSGRLVPIVFFHALHGHVAQGKITDISSFFPYQFL